MMVTPHFKSPYLGLLGIVHFLEGLHTVVAGPGEDVPRQWGQGYS